VSGSRDPRRPGPQDETVEVPLRPRRGGEQSPAEEPWWKNVNTRVPPPPRMPAPRPAPKAPQPPAQPRDRPATPVRKRHAQAPPARRKGGQLALLIAVGVIAISAAAVLLMVGLSRFDLLKGKVLDVAKAEAGVQRILVDPVDGYGATSVSDVVCNNGDDPEIKKGAAFTCEVIVEGRKRQVLVVFQDDNGTYEVDRPR
jgi:Domain of unknown function (DUF4333)